ncbi:DNA-directed RNA polymerase subunit sigma [Carboxydothermus islandicus]|uniref:DNA-directed RNA polymerase subunit sigma n=1 Tax=Carboxydothermus islandicus TaxID=661089 RepID=A0A1L8D2J3_9THEO|nr:sigma-70 family RNA polymerase sigma factor [Carboxydothermus islandicus]GAV25390.1 DNA-directed RNA polymerase subunit sigma [Carboxydothermus islandicus]
MWQELYRIVYHYLLKLGLSHADAEDIAQEVLLSTYLHLDSIHEGNLKFYVLATAKNKYIDFLRKNKREFTVPSLGEFDVNNFSEIHQIENREVIKKAICKLNLTEQKLFYMKYYLGMTNPEISSLLKISPDSVKTMLWRLRKKVKEYLKKEEEN